MVGYAIDIETSRKLDKTCPLMCLKIHVICLQMTWHLVGLGSSLSSVITQGYCYRGPSHKLPKMLLMLGLLCPQDSHNCPKTGDFLLLITDLVHKFGGLRFLSRSGFPRLEESNFLLMFHMHRAIEIG